MISSEGSGSATLKAQSPGLMSLEERHALSTLASSRQAKSDVEKIIKGYRKVSEDWRSILRADYLMMLKTLACIKKEHVIIRTRAGEVWVGRLSAIDPDHLNVLILDAENVIIGLRVSKVLIRGDQVELILHFPSREQAERAVKRLIVEKL